jgi:lysophospholipase L1-like esterase
MPRARVGSVLALAAGVAVALLLAVAADLWLLPLALPLPRDVWLMGFAASDPIVDGVPVNALGFTGDLAAGAKPPGTLRVLTLGGSALFNRRFTERLRARLAAEAPGRIEILGAALRAHTSRSSLLKWRLLRDRDFDVVILYEGINDLYANHVDPALYREDYAHLGAWYVRGPMLDRSVIGRRVYNDLLHRPAAGRGTASGFRSIETLRANLRELVGSIRAHGGEPVLSTTAWAIPADYDRERFLRGELGYANPERHDDQPVERWGPAPWVREGLQRTNVAIHELAAETGAPLFDAEAALGRDLRWFGDVCHPSEAGVDRLVGALAAFLRERDLLRPRG